MRKKKRASKKEDVIQAQGFLFIPIIASSLRLT